MSTASVRIAQISDLHFGRHVAGVAAALRDELHDLAPTMTAVCGDLTQTAAAAEFAAARAFLDGLPGPLLVVPGNHDLPGGPVWSRFADPWREWRRHMATDPRDAVRLTAPGLVAVGVTTARSWGPYLDWSRGRVDGRQVNAVLAAFADAPDDALRVAVAHHPFLLTDAGRHRGLVGRSASALRRLRGRCDLLLGGHIHLGYSGVTGGMSGGVVVAQSGTGVSDRLKGEPNGYNLIEGDRDRLTVSIRQWEGDRFRTTASARYHRDGREWADMPQ